MTDNSLADKISSLIAAASAPVDRQHERHRSRSRSRHRSSTSSETDKCPTETSPATADPMHGDTATTEIGGKQFDVGGDSAIIKWRHALSALTKADKGDKESTKVTASSTSLVRSDASSAMTASDATTRRKCANCHRDFAHTSMLARILVSTKNFVQQYDADATKAFKICAGVPLKQHASKD